MLDSLDETINCKLHVAWNALCRAHPPGPWREYEFPIMFHLKSGGAIKILFENEETPLLQEPGTVSILPAFRKRRIELVSNAKGEPLEISALGISYRLHGNIDLLSFWDIPLLLKGATAEAAGARMRKLVEIKKNADSFSLKNIIDFQKISMELLSDITLSSQLRPGGPEKLEASRVLEPAIELIRKRFHEDLNTSTMAASCNMSRTLFFQKFKKLFGTSPIVYLQNLRFAEARGLLLNTDCRIAEIAEKSGWNDPFHFSRIFKKYSGYSPAKFREKFRKEPDIFL